MHRIQTVQRRAMRRICPRQVSSVHERSVGPPPIIATGDLYNRSSFGNHNFLRNSRRTCNGFNSFITVRCLGTGTCGNTVNSWDPMGGIEIEIKISQKKDEGPNRTAPQHTPLEGIVEESRQSNRAIFRATPVVPSILQYIERIGVGLEPRQKRRVRRDKTKRSGTGGGRGGADNTLDQSEEQHFLLGTGRQNRSRRAMKLNAPPAAAMLKSRLKGKETGIDHGVGKAPSGAWRLPPPPFSSSSTCDAEDDAKSRNRIIRRPVKLLGKAGSLKDDLPLASIGLSEVALAGRSNVGKSTLLNALLYGNIDERMTPKEYKRGKTPDVVKLPKGIKAIASDKPGETKELMFYQLTADVTSKDENAGKDKNAAKMSLLMVDLPGYGFAFAKEERSKDWLELMHHYLLERRSLKRILLLLDARHGMKKSDLEFLSTLQEGLLSKSHQGKSARRELPPIQIVLTKCDLVKQSDLARRVVTARQQLSDCLIREPSSLPVMLVSAMAGLGFNNIKGGQSMGGVLELQKELASLVPVARNHRKG